MMQQQGVEAHHGVPMMYAQTVDGSAGGYVPVVMTAGGGPAGANYGSPANSPMSMYQQQQQMHMAYLQQQQMYANYAAASMAASSGSLGSSYGHSMSPGNLSYMHIAEQQNNALIQQQQHQQQLMMQQAQLRQQAANRGDA